MKSFDNKSLSRIKMHSSIWVGKALFCTALLFTMQVFFAYADSSKNESNDLKLIDDYINSKGYGNTIVFDASNIKQFWVDNTVLSKDNSILISLNGHIGQSAESVPLKIQLANVIETQDCKIDVIADSTDISFSVSNSNRKISHSSSESGFIQYHVESASFHIEDMQDFSFFLSFISKTTNPISIKKIVLSFSDNKQSKYAGSLGFSLLSKTIDEKGIALPNTDVKYLISKEHNKIFFKIPNELSSFPFFHHAYPIDKKDFTSPDREKAGCNNHDFSTKREYVKIPVNPFSQSNYTILQLILPSYRCSKIHIGQFNVETGQRYWDFELKEDDLR